MITASMSAKVSACMVRSWLSQTPYSSAVRLESVAERHCATHSRPSCTAKRVLVLPCSMASSIRRAPRGMGKKTSPAVMRRMDAVRTSGGGAHRWGPGPRLCLRPSPDRAARCRSVPSHRRGRPMRREWAQTPCWSQTASQCWNMRRSSRSSASAGVGGAIRSARRCSANAVAGRSGLMGGVFKFTPQPTASQRAFTAALPDSIRTPETFRPATITSFGHFSVTSEGGDIGRGDDRRWRAR